MPSFRGLNLEVISEPETIGKVMCFASLTETNQPLVKAAPPTQNQPRGGNNARIYSFINSYDAEKALCGLP